MVILPEEFKKQQDQVWEMLRVLGISWENYHNIFYDDTNPPKKIAQIIEERLKKIEEKYDEIW